MGGRGAGKTRAGGEWLRHLAENACEFGRARSIAIVADRMFKSAPAPLLPAAGIVNGWAPSCND